MDKSDTAGARTLPGSIPKNATKVTMDHPIMPDHCHLSFVIAQNKHAEVLQMTNDR